MAKRKGQDINPETGKPYPPGKHPNSIAAFEKTRVTAPQFDGYTGKLAAEKAAETRRKRRAAAEAAANAIKAVSEDYQSITKALDDAPESYMIMKAIALKFIDEGNTDEALPILEKIANYESSKKQAVENTNREVGVDELTDEELDELLKEATNVRKFDGK